MPVPIAAPPTTLRPYLFHGLRLGSPDSRGECHADCPACGRDKFSVNIDTGLCSCYAASCPLFVHGGDAGGSLKFLRWLWEESFRRNGDGSEEREFAAERGFLHVDTLDHWGFCRSAIDGAWLVPAHSPDGALTQLYKRIPWDGRWEYRPTPEMGGHAMHGVPLYDQQCESVWLCEKASDAAILWEAMRMAKWGDSRRLEFTGNPSASLLATASVLAVPNCGAVGEPLRRYLPLFQGKRVMLCFDSDHAIERNGHHTEGAGLGATKRAAAMLQGVASEVAWLAWGADGVAAGRESGWDVRDVLRKGMAA